MLKFQEKLLPLDNAIKVMIDYARCYIITLPKE